MARDDLFRSAGITDQTATQKVKDDTRNPAAVALGRLGGAKGGRVRAARLTPAQRSDMARKMAQKRWATDASEARAWHASPDLRDTDFSDRILDVATRMFAKSGYAGVAMRDLARAVGTSLTRIYGVFPDKGALYQRCCLVTYNDYKAYVDENVAAAPTDADKVLAFAKALCRYQSRSSTHMIVMRHHIHRESDVLSRVSATLFSGQFMEIEQVVARLTGDQELACEKTYALYSLIFGYYQLSPYAELSGRNLPTQYQADRIAESALRQIIPSMFGGAL